MVNYLKSQLERLLVVHANTSEKQRRGHLLAWFIIIFIALGIGIALLDAWHARHRGGRFDDLLVHSSPTIGDVSGNGVNDVVVGSHGRGWMERLLIGSTTEQLLNQLPTSLLVVPVPRPVKTRPRGSRGSGRRRQRRAGATFI